MSESMRAVMRPYGGGWSVRVEFGDMEYSAWTFTRWGARRWARKAIRERTRSSDWTDITSRVIE